MRRQGRSEGVGAEEEEAAGRKGGGGRWGGGLRGGSGGRGGALGVRGGLVTAGFIALARKHRSPAEEAHLDALKLERTDLVMSRPAAEVYDIAPAREVK